MHTHFRAPLCGLHPGCRCAGGTVGASGRRIQPVSVGGGGAGSGLGSVWAHAERGAVRACGCVEGGALDVVVVGARAARGMPRWRWQGVGCGETREAWCRGGRWPGLRGSEGEALHCAVQRASI